MKKGEKQDFQASPPFLAFPSLSENTATSQPLRGGFAKGQGWLFGIPVPGCQRWLGWAPGRARTPGPRRRAHISPRDEISPSQPGCHVPLKHRKTHSGSRNEKGLSWGEGGEGKLKKKKKKGENATCCKASEFSNKPKSAENTFYKHAAKLAAFVWAFVKH